MKLQELFHGVEDAAHRRGTFVAGDRFDAPVRKQIDVEFGPDALYGVRQCERPIPFCHFGGAETRRIEEVAQHRRVVPGHLGEAFINRHRRDRRVDDHRADCVLKGRNLNRFVDEGVLRPSEPPHLVYQFYAAHRGFRRDQKHFEIWAPVFAAFE